jgi:hypothetical protein
MERRKTQQSTHQSTCTRCGRGLEAGRVLRKTSRYCRECAPIARREQSAAWKQRVRALFGWRKYHDDYSPFVDADAERAHRRDYMRQYRKRKREGNGSAESPFAMRQQAA